MKRSIIAAILFCTLHVNHIRCDDFRIAALREIAHKQLKQHVIVPAAESAQAFKGSLDAAKEAQRQAILDPNSHDLGREHLVRCKGELRNINDRVRRATKHLSSAGFSSKQGIEDQNLMQIVLGKFDDIERKLDGIDNRMLRVPANDGSRIVQASRQKALAKLRRKTLAVQLDLEKFFAVVDGEQVQLDRPETLNITRLLQHFYGKYSDGMPPVLIEWVHVACTWYNAWFAGSNPIPVPALPVPTHDRSGQPAANVCPAMRPSGVLGAIARIEEVNTDLVVGGGGPTRLTQTVQKYRTGRGGVVQQLWNSITTKMSNAFEPSASSSRIGAFVKRAIARTVRGAARVALWCAAKVLFKKGTFEYKPWEKRPAGQLCNGLARGWFRRPEEQPTQEEPQAPWWRRWFGRSQQN